MDMSKKEKPLIIKKYIWHKIHLAKDASKIQ
jgi:hypothetical protein